jgi:hypothetical protein
MSEGVRCGEYITMHLFVMADLLSLWKWLKMCQMIKYWKKRVFRFGMRIFFVYLQAEFRQKCNLF